MGRATIKEFFKRIDTFNPQSTLTIAETVTALDALPTGSWPSNSSDRLNFDFAVKVAQATSKTFSKPEQDIISGFSKENGQIE